MIFGSSVASASRLWGPSSGGIIRLMIMHRRIRLTIMVLAALLLVIAVAPNVQAATSNEVKTLRKRMVSTFRAKRYRASLTIALRLYELARDPKYLANVGRCYDLLGDEPRAIEYYQRYLRESHDRDRRRVILTRIATLERQFQRRGRIVEVTSDPRGAEVYLDGERKGPSPLQLMLPKGKHTIELRYGGHRRVTREVWIAPGPKMVLALRVEERRPAPPSRPGVVWHAGRFFVGLQIGVGVPMVRSKEAPLRNAIPAVLFTERLRPHVQLGLSIGLDVLRSRLETRLDLTLSIVNKVNACSRPDTFSTATCTTSGTDGVITVVDIANVWGYLFRPTRHPFFLIPELGLGGFVVKHKNIGTNAGLSLHAAFALSYRFGRHVELRLVPVHIGSWFPISGQWNDQYTGLAFYSATAEVRARF